MAAYLLAQALIRLGLLWSAVSLLRATDALLAVKWLAIAMLCAWVGDWDNIHFRWRHKP